MTQAVLVACLIAGGVVGLGLVAWAFWYEPAHVRVVTHRIDIPELPSDLRGLRIAVISDLHAGSRYVDAAAVDRIVALANGTDPDLVLLSGDFMVNRRMKGANPMPPEEIARHLQALRARLGVWAVLGNHDWYGRWFGGGAGVTKAFEAAGIPMLDNRTVPLPGAPAPLWLVGVGDAYTQHDDVPAALAGLPEDGVAVCFTHSPDAFPDLPANCLLTIAGHTHGGQVVFPLVGALFVPSRYGSRYLGGLIVENGRRLFVSTGIGTTGLPVRFGVPPEISLLILQ